LQSRWRRSRILPSKVTILRTSFSYEVLEFVYHWSGYGIRTLWGGNAAPYHMTSYHEPASNAPRVLTRCHRVRGVKPPGELESPRPCRSTSLPPQGPSRLPNRASGSHIQLRFSRPNPRGCYPPLNDSTRERVANSTHLVCMKQLQ